VVVCPVTDFSDSLNRTVYASPLKRLGLLGHSASLHSHADKSSRLPFGNRLRKVIKRGGSPIPPDDLPAPNRHHPSLLIRKPARSPDTSPVPMQNSLASLLSHDAPTLTHSQKYSPGCLPSPHSKPLLTAHSSLLIRPQARSPSRLATPNRHHCSLIILI
jgi:hypothetical protein